MVIATFRDGTQAAGQTIVYDNGVFSIPGGLQLTAAQVFEYGQADEIVWASNELREWVWSVARTEAAPAEATPTQAAQAAGAQGAAAVSAAGATSKQTVVQQLVSQGWTEVAARQVTDKAMAQLAARRSGDKIARGLVKQGWDANGAALFVSKVAQAFDAYAKTPEGNKALRRKYAQYMLWGGGVAAVCVVLSVITIINALQNGSGATYVIITGPVVVGIYFFFKGLGGWGEQKRRVGAQRQRPGTQEATPASAAEASDIDQAHPGAGSPEVATPRQGARRRGRFPAWAMVLVVAVALAGVVGGVLIVRSRAGNSKAMVEVFILDADEGGTPEKVQALEDRIAAMPEVKSYTYISKDQALEDFRKGLSPSAAAIINNMPANPLPASYRIYVKEVGQVETVARRFLDDPVVDNSPGTHDGVRWTKDGVRWTKEP